MAYNPKYKLQENVLAVETMLRIAAGQNALADDIAVLRKYSGFGGIKAMLYPATTREEWTRLGATGADFQLFDDLLRFHRLLSQHYPEAAYRKIISGIKNSMLSAFYTPAGVPEAVFSAIQQSGIMIRTMYDPSAGAGVFVEKALENLPDISKIVAVEKDSLTAKILSAVYRDDNRVVTTNDAFETVSSVDDASYDLVASNIPFGNFRITDTSFKEDFITARIHNYFFAKALTKLRDGGILAFITTSAFLNSEGNESIRRYMLERSNFISAFVMPDNLMKETGNTEAPSHLVILQKNERKKSLTLLEEKVLRTVACSNEYGTYRMNAYLQENRSAGRNQYGEPHERVWLNGDINSISSGIEEQIKNHIGERFSYDLFIKRPEQLQPNEKSDAAGEFTFVDPPEGIEDIQTVQLGLFDAAAVENSNRALAYLNDKDSSEINRQSARIISIIRTDERPDHETIVLVTARLLQQNRFVYKLHSNVKEDGKEKGGFVYYTIDVTKGNNVTAPAFTEMVMNGGFEDGSEVKRIGADEAINNTSADMDFSREGHFNMGHHMGDSHPYDYWNLASQPFGTGLVIKNSTIPCGSGQTIRYPVGLSSNSCPGGTSWAAAPNIGFPLPGTNGGERYMQGQAVTGSFFLMADSVRSCHYYTVEYDTYAPTPFTAGSFNIGFVDSVVCGSASFANFFNQGYTSIIPVKSTIATTFDSVWTHHTVHFWWCGNPKGILYINTLGPPGYVGVLLDNISLKEDSTASPLTASITQTILSSCQTVTLTGHAVDTACHVTYTWLHNGQVISNFQSVNVQVNPGGVYTLVVNDGCRTATDSINVSASSVTATVTSSGPCVPATLTASPTGAGYTYSWPGPGGFSSTANPVTATQPGVYTVTVSNSSCSSSASYTVNGGGNACCNAAIAAAPGTMSFSNTTASAMLSQLYAVGYATNGVVTTNNYIVIDGTLTVNTPLTFANCPNVVFTSSATSPAQIVLNSGQTLNIKQSKLRAACGYMWQGITASDPGNTITISGSELHDMINGVICSNGALLLANNTRFEDNYIGIQLYDVPNNPNLNQPATYAGVIKTDTFTTSVNKLIAPYAGKNSHTGIFTRNSRGVTIGGNSFPSEGNIFSKLATGIYIDVKQPGSKLVNYVSTTNVYNNSFSDITGGAYGNQTGTPASQSIYNDPDGTAVYGKNVGTIPTGNVINVTNSANSSAQFTNCTKGITLTGMSANVTNTRYNNLTWGMNFGNASQAKYVVNNNNMQNVYYGVSVNGSPNAMTIARNKYNSPNTYFQTFNNAILLYPVGISLSAITNTSGAGTVDSIYSDTLNMNALSGIAINLQNTGTEVKALKNYISLNPPNSGSGSGNIPNNLEMQGIAVSNALGSTIAGNHITGNAWAITTSRTNVAAVAMTSSQQLRLNCNHTNNMRFGFLTVGNCTTDTFAVTSNDFGGQSNGMLFRHLGNIGTLGQIGTRTFDNSNTFTPPFASDANGNQMRLFTVSICSQATPNLIFTGYLTSAQSGGNNAPCRYNPSPNVVGYGAPNTCLYQGLQRIGKVPDIDGAILIARNQVDYDEYTDVVRWLNQSQLFDELTVDTDARTNNPVLDSFYQAMQAHPIRDVSDLNHQLQDIMNALAQGDADLYDQLLHDAQNANGNIGNSDQMAANERQINDVYIKYSKKGLDSLNTGDSTVIASLALQCPLIGGSAVYKARMLYGLIAPVRGYDDIDICNSAGAYKGGKHPFDDENALLSDMQIADETLSGFKVYPNPANETITVDYMRGGTFTLTDMLGRVIKTVALGDHAGKTTVDIHNLMPGVYTYTHIVDGKLLDFGKLVVTK